MTNMVENFLAEALVAVDFLDYHVGQARNRNFTKDDLFELAIMAKNMAKAIDKFLLADSICQQVEGNGFAPRP